MFSGVKFTILALVWSAIILAIDVFGGAQLRDQWRSSSFAMTTGKVTRSQLAEYNGRRGRSFSASVEIAYSADGLGVRRSDFTFEESKPEDIVAAHPIGSTVQVYYNRANPAQAVLRRGMNGEDFWGALFLFSFNCSLLAILLAPLAWIRNALFHPPAGGIALIVDATTTRARVGVMSPPFAFLATAGLVSFCECLILSGLYGKQPPLSLVALAWVAMAAIAFLGPWLSRKSAGDERDLIIYMSKQILVLPLQPTEKLRSEVPCSDVSRTIVRIIKSRITRGGTTISYYAEIRLKEGYSYSIAEFYWLWRARAFTRWLAEQLKLPAGSAVCEFGYAGFRAPPTEVRPPQPPNFMLRPIRLFRPKQM